MLLLLQKLPRVDVGCLEEVLSRMEGDDKGEWSDVVFVPPAAVEASTISSSKQRTRRGK